MSLFKLSLSNIKRNYWRSILTAISIAISATTITIVLSLDKGYKSSVKNELVNKSGVHLYITKEGCPIEAASVIAQGGVSPLYVSEEIIEKISSINEISSILPFQLFSVTTEDGSRTDIFMGITKEIEKIRPDWKLVKGEWFTSDSSVILGAEVARIENVNVGEKIYSENFNKEFIVTGIVKRNYNQDDGMFFIPLKTAQKLIGREGKLSAIALKLKDISTLEETKNKIRALLPSDYFVIGAKELSDGILTFYQSTQIIMFVMIMVALIISAFGIINTMLMSVLERKKEFAYLKCVGAGKSDLIFLITFETLIISIGGSILGTLTGIVVSPQFSNFMKKFLVAYIPTESIAITDVYTIIISFSLCIITGVICSLYPALRAASVLPMEVLRNE